MENTLDSILERLAEMSRQVGVIDPDMYLRACEKLNALLQGEQERLFDQEYEVALMRKSLLEEGKTSSYTKMVIEASDEYRKARTQKAKIDRALETIRIGKSHARLATELMKNQM